MYNSLHRINTGFSDRYPKLTAVYHLCLSDKLILFITYLSSLSTCWMNQCIPIPGIDHHLPHREILLSTKIDSISVHGLYTDCPLGVKIDGRMQMFLLTKWYYNFLPTVEESRGSGFQKGGPSTSYNLYWMDWDCMWTQLSYFPTPTSTLCCSKLQLTNSKITLKI